MIDSDNITIVRLISQLTFIDPTWMLEYAIEQKNSRIAKSLFISDKIDRAKYVVELLRLMVDKVNIDDLFLSIKNNTCDPFDFIFGMKFTNDEKKIKTGIINAILLDNEIDSDIKIALIDISPEKKIMIRSICNNEIMAKVKDTSFEYDHDTKIAKIVIEL
jgi:uncharacterized protein YabN with tetrapyrrole methylase and pyrophosphatase domain